MTESLIRTHGRVSAVNSRRLFVPMWLSGHFPALVTCGWPTQLPSAVSTHHQQPKHFLDITILTLMSPALMTLVPSFDPPCTLTYNLGLEAKMMVKRSRRFSRGGVRKWKCLEWGRSGVEADGWAKLRCWLGGPTADLGRGQIPRFSTIAGKPSPFGLMAVELGTCQYSRDRLNTSSC